MARTSSYDASSVRVHQYIFNAHSDVFTFGKHCGRTINSVIQHDPAYILWCVNNVHGFTISDSLLQDARDSDWAHNGGYDDDDIGFDGPGDPYYYGYN